jgi:hypothetical protein
MELSARVGYARPTRLDSSGMRELRREIDIDAPPSAVWGVLTNTGSYPDWNPFIRRIGGDLREGAKLEVRIEPPGGRAMTFKPTVLTVENESELRWLGRFLLRGLFDGEHIFRIEALGDSRTRFTQAERFSGILVPVFGTTLDKTELGFEHMNTALKAQAEARY